jgi:hypothetical protein
MRGVVVVGLVALLGFAGVAGCSSGGGSSTSGWQLTIYYTPVDRYHAGDAQPVVGCARPDCNDGAPGGDDLGSYPGDFVDAVVFEGNGRITDGPHAGQYLNWTDRAGFWIDVAPRDHGGKPLVPFVSADADEDVLAGDTAFRVEHCGRAADGTEVAEDVCARVQSAHWVVGGAFGADLGGAKHVDIYVGEESSADFTESGWFTTLTKVDLAFP